MFDNEACQKKQSQDNDIHACFFLLRIRPMRLQ